MIDFQTVITNLSQLTNHMARHMIQIFLGKTEVVNSQVKNELRRVDMIKNEKNGKRSRYV